jgi:two-component sensor histidine kinase
LAQFGGAALHGANLGDIVDLALACAARGLGVSRVAFLSPGPASTLIVSSGAGWESSPLFRAPLEIKGRAPAALVYQSDSAVGLCFDRGDDGQDWPEFLVSGGVHALVCACVRAGEARHGVIEAAADAAGHFNPEDGAFLATLANLLGAAFSRLGQVRPIAQSGNLSPPSRTGGPMKFLAGESTLTGSLIERLPVGIALLDGDGRIIRSNTLYTKYASAEITSESYAYAKSISKLRSNTTIEELSLLLGDGPAVWVRLESFPLLDQDDPNIASCAIVSDITKWKSSRSPFGHPDLPHRIRNILSVIRVIARRTAERSESVEDYAAQLESRINALARVQTGMMTDPQAGVDLGMLITDELLAHSIKGEQVKARGPRIKLGTKAAETLALAIHELTENAIKYGALSAKSGQVDITWRIDTDTAPARLEFEWREFGVSIVGSAPRRRGFGHELIERTLPYELAAATSIDFRPGGIRCSVAIPLASRTAQSQFTLGETT